ncbi:transporter substrate-binding domain-containing protein [Kibdelosporangium philippinense]|uniref:Transporter substrate-binding domain-containing protein n=1 Tax=Kibdelosporangium philippinense TaxID=211113 RepID=A0ABS8Z3G4_9PSEU|nr:transporter substrate-binding domain-containing protein [Kibdelosporangium philippinense]MCE7002468.1 transporter substrate-binding domain-containing protein [Kibdelosporangium philippinense]
MLRSILAVALVLTLAACGGEGTAASANGETTVAVGALSNGAATETSITVKTVEEIRAKVPQRIRDSGTLKLGVGALPSGSPPLQYIGTDHKTITGSESDLARLVAGVLGLKPEFQNSTWENMFVGIDSDRVDAAFSNITDTEKRKEKYDFASYRKDNLAFEALQSNPWTFTGDYRTLAGQKISVGKGTNQEKILIEWQTKLRSEGKDFVISYYPDINAAQLAINSGQIDTYLGPSPGVLYQIAQSQNSPNPKKLAGTHSGAGESLQGLIAATTKKDSGLVEPLADAINHLIANGQYQQWLDAWHLSSEAVEKSEINPPGLPLTNT